MNADPALREEVVGELEHLVDISNELRDAMLTRDADKIMNVVARGEQLSFSRVLQTAPPYLLEDDRVGSVARRLRRLQDSNRLLATSFLKLYRQILRPASASDAGQYGRTGSVETSGASPLLINQIG